MKIVVSVIVFNRLNNVKRWISCWQSSNTGDAELVIIHNDNNESEKFKAVCDQAGIKYIKRPNIGFDIGAFQDVVRGRLEGFLEWDYLLWCTDDCVPMSKDFITPFIETLQDESVGISCMKISTAVNHHVRTTGFCLKKEVAQKLEFHSDPLKTKQECYLFEHRGGAKTLTNQIRAMGLSCRQVAPSAVSPLWDQGYHKRLNRAAEHERIFPSGQKEGDKVVFICPIYNTYPGIISSLILQTHQNWELLLIHDGPSQNGMLGYVNNTDKRVKYLETPEHKGNWGHYIRRDYLQELTHRNDIDYVIISNPDNYYVPVFLEYLIKGINKSHTSVAAYCSSMVHSYKAWDVLPCRPERGFLDCGGVMVKKDIACEVGFNNITDHSADWLYFQDIANKYSWRNFLAVKGCLFVHN